MQRVVSDLTVRIASTAQDLLGAQRLRYRVFVEELGGSGGLVDHDAALEIDRFDQVCEHLVLIDPARNPADLDHVVGVYRLLRDARARQIGQFYSEDEYDLTALKNTNRRLLELGRSCIDKNYRRGGAMARLWQGLFAYITDNNIEILFGVASFHGVNIPSLAPSLSLLHQQFLAPKNLRTKARRQNFQTMDLIAPDDLDRKSAMVRVPPLIKSYLKIGGYIGEGAFIDHAFNTTDICMILDIARVNEKQKAAYLRGERR